MRSYAVLAAAVLALFPLAAVSQTASAPAKSAHTPVQKAAPPQVVALTPPMGWNSWNFFAHKVTDQDIRNAADQLVSTGMKDAGYIYVNIDDTWEGDRDANGVLPVSYTHLRSAPDAFARPRRPQWPEGMPMLMQLS